MLEFSWVGAAADAVGWFIRTIGGVAGLVTAFFVFRDRIRKSTPLVSVQAIPLPYIQHQVAALVTNPRSTSILIRTDPENSSFFAMGRGPLDTDQAVKELMFGGWKQAIPPGATAVFILILKDEYRLTAPTAKLTVSLQWIPIQFRGRQPKLRTIQESITHEHFNDLMENSGPVKDFGAEQPKSHPDPR